MYEFVSYFFIGDKIFMIYSIVTCNLSFQVLDTLTILFWLAMFIMVMGILILHRRKQMKEEEREEMRIYFISILQDVIWSDADAEDNLSLLPDDFQKLLENELYRNWFIEDLIATKKNLSGMATKNLEKLYDELGLQETSFKKLKDIKWHVKALGIQELYMMENTRYLPEIFELTRHPNEFVRAEAQVGMIFLKEFEGLVFLDNLELPVSEWDQIRLLNHLSHVTYESMGNVGLWLQSSNNSVVMFALKFVGVYHLFNFQKEVTACLQHPNKEIKLQTLEVLKAVYTDNTDESIVEVYDTFVQSSLRIKALETLKVIGNNDLLPFLQRELRSENKDIKFAAASAIAHISKYGIQILEQIFESRSAPENDQIIQHLKFELQ